MAVTDPLLSGVTCTDTTLAPGSSTQCTGVGAHTITDADQQAGAVRNTATAMATSDGPPPTPATASTSTPVAPVGKLQVKKTMGVTSAIDPVTGQASVGYSVTVSNVGGSPIGYGALVDTPGFAPELVIDSATWTGPTSGSDQGAGPYTLSPGGTLAQGASITYAVRITFHYAGTGAVTACTSGHGGGLYNSVTLAKAREIDPAVDATGGAACATAPAAPSTGLTLKKEVVSVVDTDGNNRTNPGDTITYRFVVTNTGSTVVNSLGIQDELLAAAGVPVTCQTTTLAPGGTTTCSSGVYTVTTADLYSGAVTNTATATGAAPFLGAVTRGESSIATKVTTAGLRLTKTAGTITDQDGNGPDRGDTVEFTFTVKNTGTTALSDVAVTDPRIGGGGTAVCTIATLAAKDEHTCAKVTYTLTQADVDAGTVTNTASVTGVPADKGTAPVASASAEVSITPALGSLTVVKSAGGIADANLSGRPDAGDTITYSFVVTNAGAQTVRAVTISDPKITSAPITCGAGSLSPGASTSCTATYTLTQTDYDSPGTVVNTATATATTSVGGEVTGSSKAVITDLKATAHLSVDLRAPATVPGAKVGDTVTFTVVVTNDGTQTVNGITADLPGTSGLTCSTPVSLEPGRSATCTATYVLTQADVDAGQITRSGTITSTDPVVTVTDVATTQLQPTASVALSKEVVLDAAGKSVTDTDGNGTDLGDTIRYRFTVTNTGTTTLAPVTITDAKLGISAMTCASTLAPGANATCEPAEPYRLQQPDVDLNTVVNGARADGTTLLGTAAAPGADSVTVVYDPVVAPAKFDLEKVAGTVADANGTGRQDADDTVTYTFRITNTGPLTIHGMTISDPLLGSALTCGTSIGPGVTAVCTSPTPYRLSQADIDAGEVVNTATVSGLDPKDRPVTVGERSDTATLALSPSSSVELRKTASAITDVDGNGPDAGDTIRYSFEARNTGAVTLAPVTVTDSKLGLDGAACVTSLAPGASAPCAVTPTYTLTQTDVDNRRIDNTATITATDATGRQVQADSSATVPITNVGAIALTKTAGGVKDLDDNGPDVGDTIGYTFTITNISNVTLETITLTDTKLTGLSCPATRLAPRGATTRTANSYVLTQAEVDAGRVDNAANVSAVAPGGTAVVADATETVTFTARASVALTKVMSQTTDVNDNGVTDPGDTLTYTITARNDGAVTLQTWTVTDPTLTGMSCDTGPIGPGLTKVCTGTYTVTTADQRAGRHDNTADVQAVAAGNRAVSASATASTRVATEANVDVVKSAGTVTEVDPVTGRASATYTVRVVNSGGTPAPYVLTDTPAFPATVTIDGVTWTGPTEGQASTAGPWELGNGTVGGESTHEYVVTVRFHYSGTPSGEPGLLTNTASLAGDQEQGPSANNTVSPSAPGAPSATLSMTKTVAGTNDADDDGRVSAGDTVTYSFDVVNTGTLQVTGLVVNDPGVQVTCPATTLAPKARTTCASTARTVTAGDVAAQAVTNTAAETATPPATWAGAQPSSTATATLPITTAGLTVTTSHAAPADANGNGRLDAGDTVAYSFTVTNTGSTTLSDVTVADSRLGIAPFVCASSLARSSATCTASAAYVLTQTDIDAGDVTTTTTTATGTPADGGVRPSAGDEDTLTLTGIAPALTLTKTSNGIGDTDKSGGANAGDTIT
ncbi:beta strand repeat-containing protein [Mobilicoccus caccae]|uniref:Repeat protein (TIGR01451 family) n=1 Tax=Mobilicoccus caccae TaxID=1859295 RepID=A0ABQ6IKQ2_9MICO|nr:hypothetical protein [Mobilicoccus caccae]GMA38016.1 hypothetical protein GCM10025883_00610 [Mobilicoccus caccae]